MLRLVLTAFFIFSFFLKTHSAEKTIFFNDTKVQSCDLVSNLDESNLLPRIGDSSKCYFHKKIIFENLGTTPLKQFKLISNKQDFEKMSLKDIYRGVIENAASSNPEFDDNFFLSLSPFIFFQNLPCRKLHLNGYLAEEFYWNKDWHLIDSTRQAVYLNLDNKSLAGYEDIIDDPFIALRTKAFGKFAEFDVEKSWGNFAHFEEFKPELCFDPNNTEDKFTNTPKFDLYPGEKIIFHYDEAPEFIQKDSIFGKIEHRISIKDRCKDCTVEYQSPFPIYSIVNKTRDDLILNDTQQVIKPGETCHFACQARQYISLSTKDSDGQISVYSFSPRFFYPLLTKGKNHLELDINNAPEKFKVTYVFNSEFEAISPKSPFNVNNETIYDYQNPYFILDADYPFEKIWWQISPHNDFNFIFPNFDNIQAYTNLIEIDHLSNTYFNNGQEYYFRVKGFCNGVWTDWSTIKAFTVRKPNPVSGIAFEKISDNKFKISWKGDEESDYLIFASNALDFIPSIFYDKQINSIYDGHIVEYDDNNNLLLETKENSIEIDAKYAYYRIVSKKKGHYSVPSPIIHVYDNNLSLPRTVLQTVLDSSEISDAIPFKQAKRVLLPKAYTKLELPSGYNIEQEFSHIPLNQAICHIAKTIDKIYYVKDPAINQDVWNTVSPYLLPENHPIKSKLDRIFSSSRVTLDSESVRKAGFDNFKPGRFSHAVVSKHSKLKGYLVKMFLDNEGGIIDWQRFLIRVTGSIAVRESINSHGYQHFMKVPNKWIYPLPSSPLPPPDYSRKYFILVVEDMNILSSAKNKKMWASRPTKEFLNAVFTVLQEVGLSDSIYPFNMPYSNDKKIAYIDLEYHHSWPIHFGLLLKYLSQEMQEYWKTLMTNGGPK